MTGCRPRVLGGKAEWHVQLREKWAAVRLEGRRVTKTVDALVFALTAANSSLRGLNCHIRNISL